MTDDDDDAEEEDAFLPIMLPLTFASPDLLLGGRKAVVGPGRDSYVHRESSTRLLLLLLLLLVELELELEDAASAEAEAANDSETTLIL